MFQPLLFVASAKRVFGVVLGMLGVVLISASSARAVPSFGAQTGQPCAACHVGAYGPQLKPFGRDFKLYGYVASDGKSHGLPVAVTAMASFTRTNAPQPGGAARWFAANDNAALDESSIYYAGRISEKVGGFIEVNYDGVAKQLAIGKVDVRHAREAELADEDVVFGVTVNNQPTVSDLWNSVPAWGFPYNASKLAPTPMAAALIDTGAAGQIIGAGGYALWADTVFAEVALYQPLGKDLRNTLGATPYNGSNRIARAFPYWRLALQKQIGNHFLQIGTYGIDAAMWPNGDQSAGRPDHFTDVAFDANWQWIADPNSVVSDMVSGHATWIRETSSLRSSRVIAGSNGGNKLDTLRADLSYSFAATWTPTVQVFHTQGSSDAAYWGVAGARPDSTGAIFELAYVPFGKPDSFTQRFNMRLAAQYVAYTQFDGTSRRAAANNALYLSIWSGIAF